MFIPPEDFVNRYKNASLDEILKVKEKILRFIVECECGVFDNDDGMIPDYETKYKNSKEIITKLNDLIEIKEQYVASPDFREYAKDLDSHSAECETVLDENIPDDEDNISEKIKSSSDLAKRALERKDYYNAFLHIFYIKFNYDKATGYERAQLGENPLNQIWLIDACCDMYNSRGKEKILARNILFDIRSSINICTNCDNVFRNYRAHCPICGKKYVEFNDSFEIIENQIPILLKIDFLTLSKLILLISKLIELINSNDSKLTEIKYHDNLITFYFEKEHKYFKTRYKWIYSSKTYGYRDYEILEIDNNYDKLFEDESFKKIIKEVENKTGFIFEKCIGGYGIEYDYSHVDAFTFTEDINISVWFNMDGENVASYEIDLDKMELSENYYFYNEIVQSTIIKLKKFPIS